MKILFIGLLNVLYWTQTIMAGPLYTPYGDEFEKRQSDHKMVATDIDLEDGFKITAATYNSWARGTLDGFMGHPGYIGGRSEPDVEGRIVENINRIRNFLQTHSLLYKSGAQQT